MSDLIAIARDNFDPQSEVVSEETPQNGCQVHAQWLQCRADRFPIGHPVRIELLVALRHINAVGGHVE